MENAQKKCYCCDLAGHVKSDCQQQRAKDMRKAMAAGRPFVDKSKKVSELQTTDGTPLVASATLAPDFDGYLFAITMESSWSETLCPLMRPPTALARRRANATPLSHGLAFGFVVNTFLVFPFPIPIAPHFSIDPPELVWFSLCCGG